MERKKTLLSIVLAFYAATIAYYTFYGFSKSFIEYFCVQRREGPIVYSQTVTTPRVEIFLGETNAGTPYYVLGHEGLADFTLHDNYNNVSYNEGANKVFSNLGNFRSIKMDPKVFKAEYSIGEEYFSFTCRRPYSYVESSSTCFKLNPFDREIRAVNYNPATNTPFECTFEKRLETCTLKIETQNNFFLGYLMMLASLMIFSILAMLSFKNYIFLRMFMRMRDVIQKWGKGEVSFCNPITGKSTQIKEGQLLSVLSDVIGKDTSHRCKHPISVLYDKVGSYHLLDGGIMIVKDGVSTFLELNVGQSIILSNYFGTIMNDSKSCVFDGKSHYLSTLSVIQSIKQGKCITYYRHRGESIHINDVFSSDVDFLNQNYGISLKLAKILLEHNCKFFKSLMMSPLTLCLERKTDFYHRPRGVNNSTWKWYTSDYRHILEEFSGVKIFSQMNWRKSKALEEVLADPDSINVLDSQDNGLEITTTVKKHVHKGETEVALEITNDYIQKQKHNYYFNGGSLLFSTDYKVNVHMFNHDPDTNESVFRPATEKDELEANKPSVSDFKRFKTIQSAKQYLKKTIEVSANRLKALDEKITPYLDAVNASYPKEYYDVKIRRVKEEAKKYKRILDHCRYYKLQEMSDDDQEVVEAKKLVRDIESYSEIEKHCKYKICKKQVAVKYSNQVLSAKFKINMIMRQSINVRNFYECLKDVEDDIEEPEVETVVKRFTKQETSKIFKKRGKYFRVKGRKGGASRNKKGDKQKKTVGKKAVHYRKPFLAAYGHLTQANIDAIQSKQPINGLPKPVVSAILKCYNTLKAKVTDSHINSSNAQSDYSGSEKEQTARSENEINLKLRSFLLNRETNGEKIVDVEISDLDLYPNLKKIILI